MVESYKYAQIIVDIPALELDMRTFSYSIPDELRDKISIGSPVSIPFGKQDPVFGYVVGFTDYVHEGIKVKAIFDVLDDKPLFDLDYLQFIEWVAGYYMSSLVSAISAAIPSGIWSSTKRVATFTDNFNKDMLDTLDFTEAKICDLLLKSKSGELTPTHIAQKTKLTRANTYKTLRTLKDKGILSVKNIIDGTKARPKLVEYVQLVNNETDNKRHKQILDALAAIVNQCCEPNELLKLAKTTRSTLKKLESAGFVSFFKKEEFRNPLERFSSMELKNKLQLTNYQQEAYNGILESLKELDNPGPILLYGVTGSGKTEVYFQVIEEVLKQGKTVIFLVPEITLTSQISSRMISRFGHEIVGIWHSSLSAGERLDSWRRIHSGEIRIVLGARSAVFAPVNDLGLIIIDEEQDSAYKQDSPAPRYHAREVALERARRVNARVLMGSATPDIISYYKASNQKTVYKLPYRIQNRPLADTLVVDMKEELERGNKTIFSRKLSYEIQECLNRHEQVILLINRRGYTTYVFCRHCGYVAQCKNCSIPLIYHSGADQLRCHYCNYHIRSYTKCPECNSSYIKHFGLGTQKVEDEIKRKFPDAGVLRLDSDVTTRKNAHHEIIEAFTEHRADILIGTQMVAKGHDLPEVTLVGVLAADSAFNFPDFRSMERGFQLLTQVAGRAGRGTKPGRVIFQCYSPDILPLNCARNQDYFSFYSFEIFERENYYYPPFSQLFRIILSAEELDAVLRESIVLTQYLVEQFSEVAEKIQILGPSDCIIPRIQNNFRMQILIKNLISTHGHSLISNVLKNYRYGNVKIIVDVEPMNMM